MPQTVKFRPDQPLFKADAVHLPLWIHAPGEIFRGLFKWLTVTLVRDNPLRNPLLNATLTKSAKAPHRNSYWTGQPVVKGPKWRVVLWRWGLVFTLAASIKYLPSSAWWWLLKKLGSLLKWIGTNAIPWGWAHLWWLPFIFIGVVFGVWLFMWTVRKLITHVHTRTKRQGKSVDKYEYVIRYQNALKSACDHVRGWVKW